MAAVTSLVVGGLLAASVISGAVGQRQQAKASAQAQGEQRKQAAINNAQQAIQRNRQIRQVIAQQRVAQAEQLQAGFASGYAGGVSSIGADTGSSIGAALTQEGAARGIAASQDRQSGFMQKAQTNGWSQASGIFGSLAQFDYAGIQSSFAAQR